MSSKHGGMHPMMHHYRRLCRTFTSLPNCSTLVKSVSDSRLVYWLFLPFRGAVIVEPAAASSMLRSSGVQPASSANARTQHSCIGSVVLHLFSGSGSARAHAPCHVRALVRDVSTRRRNATLPQTSELVQHSATPARARRQPRRAERAILRCRACQQQDATAPAFAVTAGIPLSGEVLTAPGQRLAELLLGSHMRDFVHCVSSALKEVRPQNWRDCIADALAVGQSANLSAPCQSTWCADCACSSRNPALQSIQSQYQTACPIGSPLRASALCAR